MEDFVKVYVKAIENKEFDNAKRYPKLIEVLKQHVEKKELTQDEMRQIMNAWLKRQGEIHHF